MVKLRERVSRLVVRDKTAWWIARTIKIFKLDLSFHDSPLYLMIYASNQNQDVQNNLPTQYYNSDANVLNKTYPQKIVVV